MKSYLLALGLVAVMPFSLAGCGGTSFKSACEDSCSKCSADDNVSESDCKSTCSQYDDLLDKTGCSGEADDVVDCVGDNDLSCGDTDDDSDKCSSEISKLSSCISAYCQDHQDDCSTAIQNTQRSSNLFSYSPGFRF